MIVFRLLGDLQVEGSTGPLDPGSAEQRGVLTILLLNAGRIVPTDVLVDQLWDGEPPDGAVATIQSCIASLRQALEPEARGRRGRVLCTRSPGYMIDLDHADVDYLHFTADARAGHELVLAGNPAEASVHFEYALARWRGPALGDLADEPYSRAWARQLDEARLDALEGWATAELARGHAERVIARLEPLLAFHRDREELHAKAMMALHTAGRPADALRVYQDLRHALAEMGIHPAPELQAIEAQILDGDPELDGASLDEASLDGASLLEASPEAALPEASSPEPPPAPAPHGAPDWWPTD